MDITGYTKLLGVIGNPVRHSLSPIMHNYACQILNLDYVYTAFMVEKDTAKEAVSAMRALGIRGVNVTMPCKQAVIPYLDKISPDAEIMNAVNTITNDNGFLTGHNTDGLGMMNSIKSEDVVVMGSSIVLFGTGGAAKAILVAAAREGAKKITLFNREGKYTTELRQVVDKVIAVSGISVEICSMVDITGKNDAVKHCDIIINATPLGMKPMDDATPIEDTSSFHKSLVVVDSVYNPVETRLLREARQLGCKAIDGRGMLLYQGAESFKLFTGADMPVEKVKAKMFQVQL